MAEEQLNIITAVSYTHLDVYKIQHIGYSQAQLAEQLNCKQNAISNLELGKGGSLKLLFLSLIHIF